jgi:type IV pilus assembly protein PilB
MAVIPFSEDVYKSFAAKASPFAKHIYALAKHCEGDAVNFAQLVVQHGYVDRDTAGDMIGGMFGRTYVNLGKTLFQHALIEKLPGEMALRLRAVPLYQLGKAVTVAMSAPNDQQSVTALAVFMAAPVSPVFSFPDELEAAITVNYNAPHSLEELALTVDFAAFASGEMNEARLREISESKQLVELSNSLVLLALRERASDVHLEPKRAGLAVRFRVDGVMRERMTLASQLALPLVSRFKIMSNLDITERRKPQDGRLNFQLSSRALDIRLSTLPTLHGEKLVLRVLGSVFSSATLNLDKLDFAPEILSRLKRAVSQPNGMLLVTGPTGSGKTTTLYAALNYVNKPEINVVTVEDPVEYEVPTVNQVMIDERAGRGFPPVLRAVLRQDPDVVLIGEIRDPETARVATQAAATGHLVLSTLHTGDAIQASTRLIDMGVERFHVAPTLVGVLTQRLVRRLCPFCRAPYKPDAEYLRQFFYWSDDYEMPDFYLGEGCERCAGTGYFGRLGMHEFLAITPRLRESLLAGAAFGELRELAFKEGYREMRYDGFKKALRGLTSIEEVVEATAGDST